MSASTLGVAAPATRHRALRPDLLAVARDLLAVWDAIAVAGSGIGCAMLYRSLIHPANLPPAFLGIAQAVSLLAGMAAPLVLRGRTVRLDVRAAASADVLARAARRMAVLACLLLAVGFLTRESGAMPRGWVAMWLLTALAAEAGARLLLARPFRLMVQRGVLAEHVAIIGAGPGTEQLLRHLRQSRDCGVQVIGVFDDAAGGGGRPLADLLDMGRQGQVDRVVLTMPHLDEARLLDLLLRLKALDVEVAHCPATLGLAGATARLGSVGGAPAMVLASRPIDHRGLMAKAAGDRLAAAAGLLLLLPLLLAIAAAIRLDSRGPVFFRQRRHGCNGQEFDIWKFRTMYWRNPAATVAQTARRDRRVTRIGRFLRRTSLDELPQLLNVLNGTMSLVGPRPHPVGMRTQQKLGEEIVAEYLHRQRVKPGITGWAQVNGHRGATDTADQVRRRIAHDLYYIENWSLLLDLRILLVTPYKLLFDRQNAF